MKTVKNKKFHWAGHAWCSQNSLIRIVIDENPMGKRPMGRQRLKWEIVVGDDVKALGGVDWRWQASDRES